MPELFCGFSRVLGFGPTRYPVACSPQAWAAGVPFHLLSEMLGLSADAHDNRLSLINPVLPPWLDWVEVRDLRLRDSSLDFAVSRGSQTGGRRAARATGRRRARREAVRPRRHAAGNLYPVRSTAAGGPERSPPGRTARK